MSLEAIRNQLKTDIEAVGVIGKVHNYNRYVKEWKTYTREFTKDDKVNNWEIVRTDFTRAVHASAGAEAGVEYINHTFTIRGFYGLSDTQASEKTFQDLVESVCTALRNDPTLSGEATTIYYTPDMPVTGRIYHDFLGAVLCHIGEIVVMIRERKQY